MHLLSIVGNPEPNRQLQGDPTEAPLSINPLFDIVQGLEDLVTAVPWFGPVFSSD